ncbi:MAG: glycosyltransferase family 2 protein [Erysipelotrichaceae bacterium]|nr:glycosyltransferase family 2 protein [Erysipelotrichaceae bacterium]
MTKFFEILLAIISVILTGYSLYYVVFIGFALKKSQGFVKHAPRTRFAIVTAARNEETVIAHLIDSLHKLNYPTDLYDIYVIPNNCTDHTKEKALEAGANVIELQYPVNCKGEVLRHTFNQLMSVEYNYDAFVVFDADNVAEPNFLAEMNNAYCDGAGIAQGYREAKNPYDTWITGSYNVYFTVLNRFINHAKFNAGLSAYISGTGFMISTDVLRKSGGWRTVTLSEDTEFTLNCMINNERVAWVPTAVTFDEQPLTFQQSYVQRTRWSSGAMQLLSLYFKKLTARLSVSNFLQNFDGIMSLLATQIQALSVVQIVLVFFSAILSPKITLIDAAIPVLISYFSSVAIAFLVLKLDHKWNKHCLTGVLTFWFFIMSWTPINIRSLFKKTTQWYEIKHTRNIKSDKLKVSHQDI